MADVAELARLRPWAYHVTTPLNFEAIAQWKRLRSASDLLEHSKVRHLLCDRRVSTTVVMVDGVQVEIRDQAPLKTGHIRFEKGYTLSDLLNELNGRVFLWPGMASGPIRYGLRHFGRYAEAGPVVVIRCRLQSLLELNGEAPLFVTSCNSGGPRSNPRTGHAVRGPSTFRQVAEVDYPLSDVKELSYRQSAALPVDAEWAFGLAENWRRLWPHSK